LIVLQGLTVSYRIPIRVLGLAFGLFAGGDDDSEVTESGGVPTEFETASAAASEPSMLFVGRQTTGSQVPGCAGPDTDRLTVRQIVPACIVQSLRAIPVGYQSAVSIAGGFVLPDNGADHEIRDTVLGWSLIGEVGAHTVHQSVRLRIRGPTFTVLHDDSYIR
jgi:hypothetical protein